MTDFLKSLGVGLIALCVGLGVIAFSPVLLIAWIGEAIRNDFFGRRDD